MRAVVDVFERASGYERENPLLAIERPETEALLPGLAGRDVLDLGSGHGHYARLARTRGARCVIALDASLAIVRASAPAAVVAAAEALPLGASVVDVVIAALVTSYVDRTRAFAEVARVLRPEGRIVISELHAEGMARGAWRRTFRGVGGEALAVEASPPEPGLLARELEAAGLRVETRKETAVDARLEPHFRRAGRRDFAALRGLPLLVHVVAHKTVGEASR